MSLRQALICSPLAVLLAGLFCLANAVPAGAASIVAWGYDSQGVVSGAPSGTGYTAVAGDYHYILALIPEPGTALLLATGLAGLALRRRLAASDAVAPKRGLFAASSLEGRTKPWGPWYDATRRSDVGYTHEYERDLPVLETASSDNSGRGGR